MPVNIEKNMIIRGARKNKSGIWKRIAELLSRPRKRGVEVNVGKLDKLAQEGDTLIVPGKVLGRGTVSKKFTVIAFAYSDSARERLSKAGCKVELLRDWTGKDISGRIVI